MLSLTRCRAKLKAQQSQRDGGSCFIWLYLMDDSELVHHVSLHYKTGRLACECTRNLGCCCWLTVCSHSKCLFFLSSLDQLACLGEFTSLSALTLDGNPVALETWYKQTVLRCVLHLRQLDMKRITVRLSKCVCVYKRRKNTANSIFASEEKTECKNHYGTTLSSTFGILVTYTPPKSLQVCPRTQSISTTLRMTPSSTLHSPTLLRHLLFIWKKILVHLKLPKMKQWQN